MSLRGHHRSANVLDRTVSFLIVRLGTSYLALPSEGVRGVLTREEAGDGDTVTAVEITYHAVDLGGLMAVSADFTGQDARTVLYSNGHSHGAIRVEDVVGLMDIDRADCLPLPPQFRREERQWFGGIVLHQGHVALIINPVWVLGELADVVGVVPSESAQTVSARH